MNIYIQKNIRRSIYAFYADKNKEEEIMEKITIFKLNENNRRLLVKFMELTEKQGLTCNNYIYGNKAGVTTKNGKIEFDIHNSYPVCSIKSLCNLLL